MFNPGDRVELVRTNDPYTRLRPGTRGNVIRERQVFGESQISIRWDDGSSLMMLPDEGDQIRKVDE